MDRPVVIRCSKCAADLGYLTGDQWVFDCSSCRTQSQPGPGDTSVEATPRVRHLQDRLDRLRMDFLQSAQVYYVKVWGGRQTEARLFPPDEAIDPGPYAASALIVLAGVVGLFYGKFWLFLGSIVFAGMLIRGASLKLERQRDGYARLKQQYRSDREAILSELYAIIEQRPV